MRFIAKQLTGWHKLNVSVCRCLARCNRSHVKCIHLKSFFFTMHFAHRRRPINDNSNFHKSASNTDRQMHKSFVFRPISIEKWIMHANFGWNETNTEWNLFAPSSPRTQLVRLFLIVTWKQTFFIFEQRRNGKRKIGAPDVEYFTMKKKKLLRAKLRTKWFLVIPSNASSYCDIMHELNCHYAFEVWNQLCAVGLGKQKSPIVPPLADIFPALSSEIYFIHFYLLFNENSRRIRLE